MSRYAALPGGALVERGLRDLASGEVSVESLLLSTASERLTALGIHGVRPSVNAEDRLWALLNEQYGDGAHARLNSLRRELVSFQHSCVN
jgi:hypothetical protein